jgi:hypothetical protein
MLEFTINVKQAIIIIWTLISVVLSLALVLTYSLPYFPCFGSWQMLTGLFFALLLVMTLPVYILIVLLLVPSKSETS